MTALDNITRKELVDNCFSYEALTEVGCLHQGTHIAGLKWVNPSLPGQVQHIWVLYHPESLQPIIDLMKDLGAFAAAVETGTLTLEDLPREHLFVQVLSRCGGELAWEAAPLIVQRERSRGNLGWITGQGRWVDPMDIDAVSTLYAAAANIFTGFTGLEKDPFLKHGRNMLKVPKEKGVHQDNKTKPTDTPEDGEQ